MGCSKALLRWLGSLHKKSLTRPEIKTAVLIFEIQGKIVPANIPSFLAAFAVQSTSRHFLLMLVEPYQFPSFPLLRPCSHFTLRT